MEDSDYFGILNYLLSEHTQQPDFPQEVVSKHQRYRFRNKCANFIIIQNQLYFVENQAENAPPTHLLVVRKQEMNTMFQKYHDQFGGHLGINKTYVLRIGISLPKSKKSI